MAHSVGMRTIDLPGIGSVPLVGQGTWRMTAGADVADLIGPESVDRFHITPVPKAEEASWKVET